MATVTAQDLEQVSLDDTVGKWWGAAGFTRSFSMARSHLAPHKKKGRKGRIPAGQVACVTGDAWVAAIKGDAPNVMHGP